LNEAAESHTIHLLKSGQKMEQSINIDKMYQPVIFQLEKLLGSRETSDAYNAFIKKCLSKISSGNCQTCPPSLRRDPRHSCQSGSKLSKDQATSYAFSIACNFVIADYLDVIF
jgi:hypothetical protein